ncbi:MAG: integrase core domain-containing protein [Gammaproteobacteria bacterium]
MLPSTRLRSATQARSSIMRYAEWYNRSGPHSSLDRKTPDRASAGMLPPVKMATQPSAGISL